MLLLLSGSGFKTSACVGIGVTRLDLEVSGKTPEPVGRTAEWQKGFCRTHDEQNPLHSGHDFLKAD